MNNLNNILELLDYPFNGNLLLRKKPKLKRELLKKENLVKKKIAILGGSTTSEVKDQLELFLLKTNIQPDFYECEFAQFYEAVMFEDSDLYKFKPEIVYLHVSIENLHSFSLEDLNDSAENKAKHEFNKLLAIWEKLYLDFQCEVIQDNFELPAVRSLGNFDLSSKSSITRAVNYINESLNQSSIEKSYLHICDRNYLSSKMGLMKWKDYSLWLSAKYSLSYEAISRLSYNLGKIIESILGQSKKCLVLDLDNTLWGGVIGDDGIDGITLGKESALGEAYLDFHSYIKSLKARGIILAICSKNDFENAKSGFDHPDSILKYSDFTAFKANWEHKSKNIVDIAKEINIGLESIVFVDDNPMERDVVRKELQGLVAVPEIGNNITNFRDILDASELFNLTSLSSEDTKRNEFYETDKKREQEIINFSNYDEYLISLEMQAEICPLNQRYLPRITQLINKTNQFNLTTKRMTEQEVKILLNNKNTISLYARLNDKFGDNGLVSVISGNIESKKLTIELWLMSCRVFKRTLENSILYELLRLAKERKIETVIGKYIPSKKNKIVSKLYSDMGFSIKSEDNGAKFFELELSKYEIQNNKNITLTEFK